MTITSQSHRLASMRYDTYCVLICN